MWLSKLFRPAWGLRATVGQMGRRGADCDPGAPGAVEWGRGGVFIAIDTILLALARLRDLLKAVQFSGDGTTLVKIEKGPVLVGQKYTAYRSSGCAEACCGKPVVTRKLTVAYARAGIARTVRRCVSPYCKLWIDRTAPGQYCYAVLILVDSVV